MVALRGSGPLKLGGTMNVSNVRLERAVTTGAFAVASPGGWEGAPTRPELGMLGAPPGTVVR
ncbi:hypothetical protein [Streptomyces tubercidicus]|uniref:hypothetical protein n=1 Tax=Streptomyces tubercidicus TaxID=47759 RepID=UPI003466F7DE